MYELRQILIPPPFALLKRCKSKVYLGSPLLSESALHEGPEKFQCRSYEKDPQVPPLSSHPWQDKSTSLCSDLLLGFPCKHSLILAILAYERFPRTKRVSHVVHFFILPEVSIIAIQIYKLVFIHIRHPAAFLD